MRTVESRARTTTFRLLRALNEAHQSVERRSERKIGAWGLAPSEFDVIMTLGNTDGMRMCDLATRTLNTKSNITRVVKDLVSQGLVARERNPQCEREVFVRLTPLGEKQFAETYPQIYEFTRNLFDCYLTGDEQQTLIELLQRLVGNSDEIALNHCVA